MTTTTKTFVGTDPNRDAHRTPDQGTGALGAIATFGRMVKFSHTVFAMPFALAAATIAARTHGLTASRVVAIVLAMVGARTAAMGFNRIVDRRIDAQNPRTAGREIPTGRISLGSAVALTVASTALFVGAAAWLGPLCLALAPVALVFLFGYSYTKRFTWLCHLVLGFAIAGGPAGAWIAVTGGFGATPAWLMLAVMTWIGGFDVLYSLSDIEFDRNARLSSIPARFGITRSLVISGALHAVTLAALVLVGSSAGLGPIYFVGLVIIAAFLVWEHAIVRPNDLSRLDVAFFSLNGWVSLAFFLAVVVDVAIR